MLFNKLVACLTGHRPFGLPWGYDKTKENCLRFKRDLFVILRNAILYGIETFLTGMAEGFDMIADETIIELKKNFHLSNLLQSFRAKVKKRNGNEASKKDIGKFWKVVMKKQFWQSNLQKSVLIKEIYIWFKIRVFALLVGMVNQAGREIRLGLLKKTVAK